MSNKHSNASAKGSHAPKSLVSKTCIFTTYSASYKPVYELLLQSVRQSKLDPAKVKALAYDFSDVKPNMPTGWRTAPWFQAQRQKFAYFRDELARLPEGEVGIFADADVQFFPNLDELEELLATFGKRHLDMMLLAEHGGPLVNPGLFFAANTPNSRTFLERVSSTLGEYGKPLHPPPRTVSDGEPEPVMNRILQSTTKNELKWICIPPENIVFGPNTLHTHWPRVVAHHAICASGAAPKMELMGRIRHVYYNWKYAEATSFPTPANPDPLATMPQAPGGVWLCKIRNKLYMRDDGGIETRNPSVVKLLTMTHEKYPDIPDFKPIYICTQDTPSIRVPGMTVLAFSTDKRHPSTPFGQEVIAVPDNVFDHWRNAGMPDYEETCALIRAAGQKAPQKQVAGWIGNAHMHQTRVNLLELAKAHPAELEATNTGVWKPVPNLPRFEVGQGRYYSLPEQVEMYAFLLDVEGNGWSGRLKLLFQSGRPVIIQDRPWEEFYFSQVKPFEHYVPVAADMRDLVKQVQWLQANPQEGERIARNAQAFAAQHLTRAAALDAWASVLRGLSS